MNTAIENAERLAEDAETLLGSGRYPSAVLLAILSIEESGKVRVLRELALATDEATARTVWRQYRSHRAKNAAWILPDYAVAGAKRLTDFRSMFHPGAEHSQVLDDLKQLSAYSDCLSESRGSSPDKVVDRALAERIVSISRLMVPKRKATTEEIDLWIEHVGPVWRKDMDSMKAGLLAWAAAAEKIGAVESFEAFEAFVLGPGA